VYLLDTNIISELVRKKPSSRLVHRLARYEAASLFTSVICIAELRLGVALRADREPFWKRLEREILDRLRVLPFKLPEALLTGDLYASQQRSGTLIGLPDLMISATALVNDLVIVTANTRHFSRVPDLAVENWLLD
jgi:predicted nucleic acid-binding protein